MEVARLKALLLSTQNIAFNSNNSNTTSTVSNVPLQAKLLSPQLTSGILDQPLQINNNSPNGKLRFTVPIMDNNPMQKSPLVTVDANMIRQHVGLRNKSVVISQLIKMRQHISDGNGIFWNMSDELSETLSISQKNILDSWPSKRHSEIDLRIWATCICMAFFKYFCSEKLDQFKWMLQQGETWLKYAQLKYDLDLDRDYISLAKDFLSKEFAQKKEIQLNQTNL